jgi:hypothetical protein
LEPWNSGNNGNGDGFLFYPPKDGTIAFDAGNAQSNRLVPSIRWELMREGMEDYEYLWLLNEGDPQIGQANEADGLASQFIDSRTLFSRVPTDLYAVRAAIAAELAGLNPSAEKNVKTAVFLNETFTYTLTYNAGQSAHTVTITDAVPATTTVLSATGSKAPNPVVNGQDVSWTVAVGSGETVVLTIEAQATATGLVENTAVFSGQETLQASAQVFVYTDQVYLPTVQR